MVNVGSFPQLGRRHKSWPLVAAREDLIYCISDAVAGSNVRQEDCKEMGTGTVVRAGALILAMAWVGAPVVASAQSPDLIFRKSTVFKLLTPNDKLATYGLDDPLVEGVACHYTVAEKGGVAGMFGVAEETSDVSLACRQYGPIRFTGKFEQCDVVFRERRSLVFKKMQIVRGCDPKRNVLVYMAYSDRLIEGSPKNSTSTVPIMPWGPKGEALRCADFVDG